MSDYIQNLFSMVSGAKRRRSRTRKRLVKRNKCGSSLFGVNDNVFLDNSSRLVGDDAHFYECVICDNGGDLLCCDKCPCTYHLQCLSPPLEDVPLGDWQCPNCSEKDDLAIALINLRGSTSKNSRTDKHAANHKDEVTQSKSNPNVKKINMLRRSVAKRSKGSEIRLKKFIKAHSPSDTPCDVQHKPDAFMDKRDVGNDLSISPQCFPSCQYNQSLGQTEKPKEKQTGSPKDDEHDRISHARCVTKASSEDHDKLIQAKLMHIPEAIMVDIDDMEPQVELNRGNTNADLARIKPIPETLVTGIEGMKPQLVRNEGNTDAHRARRDNIRKVRNDLGKEKTLASGVNDFKLKQPIMSKPLNNACSAPEYSSVLMMYGQETAYPYSSLPLHHFTAPQQNQTGEYPFSLFSSANMLDHWFGGLDDLWLDDTEPEAEPNRGNKDTPRARIKPTPETLVIDKTLAEPNRGDTDAWRAGKDKVCLTEVSNLGRNELIQTGIKEMEPQPEPNSGNTYAYPNKKENLQKMRIDLRTEKTQASGVKDFEIKNPIMNKPLNYACSGPAYSNNFNMKGQETAYPYSSLPSQLVTASQDNHSKQHPVSLSSSANLKDTWFDDELDALWIGVRRYGEGNWDVMRRDPRLKFSKHKTSEDLSARWRSESLKFKDREASGRQKSTNSSSFHGGTSKVPKGQTSIGSQFTDIRTSFSPNNQLCLSGRQCSHKFPSSNESLPLGGINKEKLLLSGVVEPPIVKVGSNEDDDSSETESEADFFIQMREEGMEISSDRTLSD